MFVRLYVCISMCVCICLCLCVCVCACLFLHVCLHMYVGGGGARVCSYMRLDEYVLVCVSGLKSIFLIVQECVCARDFFRQRAPFEEAECVAR